MARLTGEVRISVRGLEAGMYVSRLDRPWIEAPFPIEGVTLRDADDIERIRRICSFVYVDTTRGVSPDLRYLDFSESASSGGTRGQIEIDALRKTNWEIAADFDVELVKARDAHDTLQRNIHEVMTDLKDGHHLDLAKLKDGVEAMVDSVLRNPAAFAWLMEIKRRDDYHYQHALGCAVWAASFGRHLGLERADLGELSLGGMLCDVGKTRLPLELTLKQRSLTPEEGMVVRQHVEHSLQIVTRTPGVSARIIEMIASHHERHDGSGYPLGLKGSEIPMYGRIMGLVDSYDAMTSVRPYAKSRSPHQAVTELYEHRRDLFQPELVEQFIQTCGIYPTGSLVELSNGQIGVITAVHSLKRLRPTVMLLLDELKTPLKQFTSLDLSLHEYDAQGRPLNVKCGLPAGSYGIDPQELFLD